MTNGADFEPLQTEGLCEAVTKRAAQADATPVQYHACKA